MAPRRFLAYFQGMRTNSRNGRRMFGGFIIVAQDAENGQLAEHYVQSTMPLPSAGETVRTARRKAGFSVRIISKWRGAIASRVPVGYENETGFHYGSDPGN